MTRARSPAGRRRRSALLLALLLGALALGAWHAEELHRLPDVLAAVEWPWLAAALAANAASILLRACAFAVVLRHALAGATPALRHVVSSFAAGVMANALLPARAGEVGRLVVLAPHLPSGSDSLLTAGGAIAAQHLLDAFPQAVLVAFVLSETGVPAWAFLPLLVTVGGGLAALIAAVVWMRRRETSESPSAERALAAILRQLEAGLRIYRTPTPLLAALLLQCAGWSGELAGILFAFRAFGIDAPGAAAGAVLLLTNLATLLPLWPGNVGLFQAAVAAPLLASGVGFGHAILFGLGLQAIEVTTAVALGAPALAYEGVSLAVLGESAPPGEQRDGTARGDRPPA
ncbi:MAG: lysylphosphatidylglycerol synthase transmembrane domain-containing protein [Thermoleophilia bacterium]|nr:flippase-like domain-containing protein [Gaiellaceae bacterium]MDW8337625.1 lysylphosphatidylglycerol synthase transmembrane domain-containing protein [Thermoleophilia bacterium]